MHNLIEHYEIDSFSDIFFILPLFSFRRMLFLLLVKNAFSIYSFQFTGETVTVGPCVKETAS